MAEPLTTLSSQCAIPVVDGILPEPYIQLGGSQRAFQPGRNALGKLLTIHTDTKELGRVLTRRLFCLPNVCLHFKTKLPIEERAHERRQATKA